MVDGILYCLNLNSSMHFRLRSRSPVTFKKRLYVTTDNNNFQSLTIFCHKELHLRFCIGLELNILTLSTKILKGIEGHPLLINTHIIKCNLGKIRKANPPRCPKIHSQYFAFNIKWSKWS